MFQKLRNRFLLLNLATNAAIMLVAFASIYAITYQNTQSDIQMELRRIADFHYKSPDGDRMSGNPSEGPKGPKGPGLQGPGGRGDGGPPPDRTVSFAIRADALGALASVSSQFEMDETFYAEALKQAIALDRDFGQFGLDDSHWAFSAQPLPEGGRLLTFLDVSTQQSILTSMISTFAVVGLVMGVVLFGASRYFANRSIRPVQEAFWKQKQFIADASHELKTPLTIIGTNADVLLANSQDPIHRQAKWLHYIKAETERMARLTNSLLYLTEMEDARTPMLAAPCNWSEIVENGLLTMEAVLFEKQIALDYTIEPGLVVQGNKEQLAQVVMILLDNAAKYTDPGGRVALTLARQHNEAVLSVVNTGDGIAAEHLPHIFDRFYRTDPSRARKQGGYGLGLAIARSIVEQHKGRISAKSAPGESTTFTVQFGLLPASRLSTKGQAGLE